MAVCRPADLSLAERYLPGQHCPGPPQLNSPHLARYGRAMGPRSYLGAPRLGAAGWAQGPASLLITSHAHSGLDA